MSAAIFGGPGAGAKHPCRPAGVGACALARLWRANLICILITPDIEIDEARLAAICDRYGIAELKVFGSRARGAAGRASDIDVLYTLRPGRRLGWEIEQLADELSELFGRRVDLVSLRALHPLLQPSVLAEARPVYAA